MVGGDCDDWWGFAGKVVYSSKSFGISALGKGCGLPWISLQPLPVHHGGWVSGRWWAALTGNCKVPAQNQLCICTWLAGCPKFDRPATNSSYCKRYLEELSNVAGECMVDCGSRGSNFCDRWESSHSPLRLYGQLDICDIFHKFGSGKSSLLGCDLPMCFVPISWNVIYFAILTTV